LSISLLRVAVPAVVMVAAVLAALELVLVFQ
jgi:hypothetical protein